MICRVYPAKSFFGTCIGENTDDGRLFFVEEGAPDCFFGYVESDDIFVPAGLGWRNELIEISEYGNLYLTCDSDIFTYERKVESVSKDGTLYDSKSHRVGYVAPKGAGLETIGGGGLGITLDIPPVFSLVVVSIGAVLLWPLLIGLSSVSDASKIQLLIITVVGMFAAHLVGLGRGKRSKFRESSPSMYCVSWLTREVILCISAAVMEVSLGVFDWVLLRTFGPLPVLIGLLQLSIYHISLY